jgi:hypothetical protein
MKILFIPWDEFLEALKKQNPATLELWLRRWHFTNEGVILAGVKISTPSNAANIAGRKSIYPSEPSADMFTTGRRVTAGRTATAGANPVAGK